MSSVYATKLRIGSANQLLKTPNNYGWARGIHARVTPPSFDSISMPDDPLCAIRIYVGLDLPGYDWGTYAIEAGISINGEQFNAEWRGWYPFIRKGFSDFWLSDMALPSSDSYSMNLLAEEEAEGNQNIISFKLQNADEDGFTEVVRQHLTNGGNGLDCYRVKYVIEVQHGTDPDNVTLYNNDLSKVIQIPSVSYCLDTQGYFGVEWQVFAYNFIQGGENGFYVGHPQINYNDENNHNCICNQSGREILYYLEHPEYKYWCLERIYCTS